MMDFRKVSIYYTLPRSVMTPCNQINLSLPPKQNAWPVLQKGIKNTSQADLSQLGEALQFNEFLRGCPFSFGGFFFFVCNSVIVVTGLCNLAGVILTRILVLRNLLWQARPTRSGVNAIPGMRT